MLTRLVTNDHHSACNLCAFEYGHALQKWRLASVYTFRDFANMLKYAGITDGRIRNGYDGYQMELTSEFTRDPYGYIAGIRTAFDYIVEIRVTPAPNIPVRGRIIRDDYEFDVEIAEDGSVQLSDLPVIPNVFAYSRLHVPHCGYVPTGLAVIGVNVDGAVFDASMLLPDDDIPIGVGTDTPYYFRFPSGELMTRGMSVVDNCPAIYGTGLAIQKLLDETPTPSAQPQHDRDGRIESYN